MISEYHRLTSWAPDPTDEWDKPVADATWIVDFTSSDHDRRPRFHKHYELPAVPLPREWPRPSAGVLDVLAGRVTGGPSESDLPALARLLYLSCGITRVAERRGQPYPFRAAGSAGARFPLEAYVAVPPGGTLPAGVHWYHPGEHALVRIGPPPRGATPALVITGVPWRTGWRYRERGWRHLYWDAGTMLSHVLALGGTRYPVFPDAAVAELVGADGVQEFPLVVVALGDGAPAIEATGPAEPGELDADAIEFPLVTAVQRAGDTDTLGWPLPSGSPVDASGGGLPIDDALLARSSHRLLDPSRSVPFAALTTAATVALRGVDVRHWLVVNAVDGLEPGVYRWPLSPVRTGRLREELYRAGMNQGLPRDAAFVLIATTPPTDARTYRTAQLEAGLVSGRLHLLAPAFGAGANGMTFVDSEIPALLGTDDWCLLWTCVGVGEYRPKTGGMPGAAVQIVTATPRE